MKITWVLPQNYDIPIGGYKIVYQYANHLVRLGHQVKIIFLQDPSYHEKGVFHNTMRSVYWFLFRKNPFKKEITWFKLDPRIKIDWNITANHLFFSQDEKVIATAYWTSNFVSLAELPIANKFYFLQDYEIFAGSVEDVEKTWKLPLNKFAVSSWLVDLGRNKFHEEVKFVPNFLDEADDFKVTNPIENRGNTIALLNHPSKRKNTKLGLEIIQAVRKQIPNLEVLLFGTEDLDTSNLEFMQYFKRPSRKQLRNDVYNQATIYLLPSEYEGWGLTAMEAMASGDIVVSNDNGGVNDFIKNNVNGFILNFNDRESVINQIVKIMNHRDLNIANQASQVTSEFSVDRSSATLLDVLSHKE
ncbi:glycosyltransferase family 4 protein [Leuconostoc gelidum subsp. gelidum]|uniref:glycosyltransferase family 4 protein n=1 Tax=Leuconostoc gelidum TaxID=1244 RepID=UPI001CC43D13|nr:glycosyltransferase family 4 protein [Leuconostoc gelidum]MBZ6014017.1 glycosyltransferase family 4 protein [Leuconostoc gelidum subsp. gelidum]